MNTSSNRSRKLGWILLVLIVLTLGVATAWRNTSMMGMGNQQFATISDSNLGSYDVGSKPIREANGVENMGFGKIAVETSPERIGMPYPGSPGGNALNVDERVYSKSANFDLITSNVPEYLRRTREYILSIEGRVLSSSQGKPETYQQGFLHVMVPVAKFEEATMRVTEGVSEIYSESISAQDETGRKVSIEEQLATLEEQKITKQIELVEAASQAQKTKIELEIARIDRQIAQVKSAQEVVTEDVEYSSVYISVADSVRYFDPSAELDLWAELRAAIGSLKEVGFLVAYVLIWSGVYAVVLAPVVLVVMWWRRRRAKQTDLSSQEMMN